MGLSVVRNLIFSSLWMKTADIPLFFPALQRHPRRLWIPLRTYFPCLVFHLSDRIVIPGRRSSAEISTHSLQGRELLRAALLRIIRPETANAKELIRTSGKQLSYCCIAVHGQGEAGGRSQ